MRLWNGGNSGLVRPVRPGNVVEKIKVRFKLSCQTLTIRKDRSSKGCNTCTTGSGRTARLSKNLSTVGS